MTKLAHLTTLTTLIALLLTSSLLVAKPSNDPVSVDIQTEQLIELSSNKEWLDLLHYHQIGLFSRFESQADDSNFFIAET